MAFSPYESVWPAKLAEALANTAADAEMHMRIVGVDAVGSKQEWVVVLPVPEGADGAAKLKAVGLTIAQNDGKTIIDYVAFDSISKKIGLDWDQQILEVLKSADTPGKYLAYIPALLILALLIMV